MWIDFVICLFLVKQDWVLAAIKLNNAKQILKYASIENALQIFEEDGISGNA